MGKIWSSEGEIIKKLSNDYEKVEKKRTFEMLILTMLPNILQMWQATQLPGISSSGFGGLKLMLPVSISSSSSDKSSVELLPPMLLITSSLYDSSINCFFETLLFDLDFFSPCLHLVELNTFCKYL